MKETNKSVSPPSGGRGADHSGGRGANTSGDPEATPPEERMILSSEAGGFIREADIMYYKGMGQRCDEIQEIMGRNPGWLTRWGMALLIAVALGFTALIWFLRIPETIAVDLHYPGEDNAAAVISPATGAVTEIRTANGGNTSAGDTLLTVSSGTSMTTVTSPRDGIVAYTRPLHRGMHVAQGEAVLYISGEPGNAAHGRPYGYLSGEDASKVTPGMELRLDNGWKGEISSISRIPADNGRYYFEATINDMEPDAPAIHSETGKILLSDQRLITRLWQSWRKR